MGNMWASCHFLFFSWVLKTHVKRVFPPEKASQVQSHAFRFPPNDLSPWGKMNALPGNKSNLSEHWDFCYMGEIWMVYPVVSSYRSIDFRRPQRPRHLSCYDPGNSFSLIHSFTQNWTGLISGTVKVWPQVRQQQQHLGPSKNEILAWPGGSVG